MWNAYTNSKSIIYFVNVVFVLRCYNNIFCDKWDKERIKPSESSLSDKDEFIGDI